MSIFFGTIGERLKAFREHLKLTQGQIASDSSILQKDISRMESGTAKTIKDEYIQYLYNKGIDLNWLYTGSGYMVRGEQDVNLNVNPTVNPTPKKENRTALVMMGIATQPKEDIDLENPVAALQNRIHSPPIQPAEYEMEKDIRMIPMIDTRAAAGLPAAYESRTFWEDLPRFPVPASEYRGNWIVIQVAGNSMHPTLKEGDWLFARQLNDINDIREDYVHVIVTREGTVVKRVMNRLASKEGLALKSDNKQYRTYIEKAENILQIFRVHASLSYNLANASEDIFSRLNDIETRLARLEK